MFNDIFPKWVRMLFPSMMGLSWGGDDGGGGETETAVRSIVQLPDYPEAEGARVNWWDTLQKWQNEPGYGAIAPNWNDIWENARQKVQRYFYGGPEGPGAIANVKAGLARRGASEDPASATAISRLNMQQGNQLQDMAVKQAIEEATLGENGRKTWLSSLQSLSSLKPQFEVNGVKATKSSGNDYSNLGSLAGNAILGGGGISDLMGGGGGLNEIMSMFGGGDGGSAGNSDTGIGSIASIFGGGDSGGDDDWWKGLVKMGAGALGTYFGGPVGGAAASYGADALL